VWRITDPQHPNYTEPPQILPIDPQEPLPLYTSNSERSTSSASAIDSPPEYQGRDQIVDNFMAAVAQLSASRELIALVHTNIKHMMQHGNPLALNLHIASTATAITYLAYTMDRPGGSGGSSGSGSSGEDHNKPMPPDDPGDDKGPPGGGGLGRAVGHQAYNPDEHP
jgi:hypothetical protein